MTFLFLMHVYKFTYLLFYLLGTEVQINHKMYNWVDKTIPMPCGSDHDWSRLF